MFEIVLYEPEIPPNTGNIIRLCANTGSRLHLIKPIGFDISDKKLKRASLDYSEYVNLQVHESFDQFLGKFSMTNVFSISTRGKLMVNEAQFTEKSILLFGPETRGLPQSLLDTMDTKKILRIPMVNESRSLNLSNAVAITIYEAWRQNNFHQPQK
ncbi:MAG: tRNA (uridine(34)/cytosine(34)/5-carboxymethylaminomethyluridine(34)-2'-O)-methyltransferase TrmL [Gammaproteobacteria bacterium]